MSTLIGLLPLLVVFTISGLFLAYSHRVSNNKNSGSISSKNHSFFTYAEITDGAFFTDESRMTLHYIVVSFRIHGEGKASISTYESKEFPVKSGGVLKHQIGLQQTVYIKISEVICSYDSRIEVISGNTLDKIVTVGSDGTSHLILVDYNDALGNGNRAARYRAALASLEPKPAAATTSSPSQPSPARPVADGFDL